VAGTSPPALHRQPDSCHAPVKHFKADVAPLVGMLDGIWPNTDRHQGSATNRSPMAQEARAVVTLAATIVQWHREGWVVQKVSDLDPRETSPTPKAQLRNGFRSCSFAMSVQVGPAPLDPTRGDGRDRGHLDRADGHQITRTGGRAARGRAMSKRKKGKK
jgi:hypothetical protein